MQIDELLAQLQGVKQHKPNEWLALCPAHADHEPSLSITKADDRILVNCLAGCKFADVLKVLNLEAKDLFFGTNGSTPKPRKLVKTTVYPITDAAGVVIAEHIRRDYEDGTKSFPWRRNGENNLGGLEVEALPLYGLKWLVAEPDDSERPIILTEGEKACDALHDAGFLALGTVTGAKTFPSEESLVPLLGRKGRVILWPDNDDTGREHMNKIAERLHVMGVEPCIAEWKEAPPKGDAFDFIAQGGDVQILLEAAKKWEPPPTVKKMATLSDIRGYYGKVGFTWKPWLPEGHVSLIVGPQGVGKSYLAADVIAAIAGTLDHWPDGQRADGKAGKVLFLETEEMRGAYAERWALMGLPDDRVVLPIEDGNMAYVPMLPGDYDKIFELGKAEGVRAVLLDSLSGGHGIDENSGAMRGIMQALVKLAGELKVPVIAVHHLRKKNQFEADGVTLDRVRGSSTITQFCRSVIGLSRASGEDSPWVRVESLKNSFAKAPPPFGFEITDNGITFGPAPEALKQETALDRAIEFLRVELRKEPQRFTALLERVEANGISKATLYRAKDSMGLNVVNGLWSLPAGHEK